MALEKPADAPVRLDAVDVRAMRTDPAERLVPLGLTQYQARAYCALVSCGRSTAADVAVASGIPQARVYAVLKELSEKGLVAVDLGPPAHYAPVPIDGYLQSLADSFRERAKAIELDAETIAAQLRPRQEEGSEDAGRMLALRGKRGILAAAHEVARGARERLVVAGSGPFADDLAKGLVALARERSQQGVRVEVVLSIGPREMPHARSLARHAEVRHNERAAGVFALVADDRAALVGHGRGLGVLSGHERALLLNDRGLVRFAHESVVSFWEHGLPIEERIGELEGAGRPSLDVLRDPGAALAGLREALASATTEFCALTSEMGLYHLLALKDDLQAARRRNVRVRIVAPVTRANARALDALERLAEVRAGPPSGIRIFLADQRLALVADAAGPGDTPFVESAFHGARTLRAKDSPLVATLAALFEERWAAAAPPGRAADSA